ncbi:PREDICTED: uncharacterized protein LOC106806224 [Priapulus caudatus]|uniref:Uncharacterized protein LOC106806224 n=1 Tax=Priapulus caudatus TaxID=37621 RepID=A0ABM1DUF9_PRICU|nr:PREDICTED: uncharacterized protein LOC106806224 [Priapulus caudatus]
MDKSMKNKSASIASSLQSGSYRSGYQSSDITIEHGQAVIYTKQPYIVGEPGKHFIIVEQKRKPTSYIAWAILVTLVCFFPTGIAAIYFARRCKREMKEEKVAVARDTSVTTKRWIICTVFLGLVIWVGVLVHVCTWYGIHNHWATPW